MRNAEGRCFDTKDLRTVADIMGWDGEELADQVTGLNCDSYADNSCDQLISIFDSCACNGSYDNDATGHLEHALYAINTHGDLDNEELWHRCLNIHIDDDADVRKGWEDGNKGTLQGMLTSSYYQEDFRSALEAIYWDEEKDITPSYEDMLKRYLKENGLPCAS